MIWQDYVMAAVNVAFVVSLIPTLRSNQKPPWATALMTSVLLYVAAATMTTLYLWMTAAAMTATATEWLVIFFQVRRRIANSAELSKTGKD